MQKPSEQLLRAQACVSSVLFVIVLFSHPFGMTAFREGGEGLMGCRLFIGWDGMSCWIYRLARLSF